ncbi:MAG TPA: metallophosphoesterase [Kofleriaceae bacterium]|nr:metallophosphoesterase [Kofleriaceae bacterium]
MRRALALLVVAASCDHSHEPPAPQSAPVVALPAPPAPPPVAQPGCTLAPHPSRSAAPAELVAIGDVHGDLSAARAALRAARAIDDHDRWIGGAMTVVQTGDLLDRGDDESKILELFERLAGEAHAAGGQLIQLLGNHELMNAAGDFRYVTPGGMQDFGGDRAGALGPGGAWARRLAAHDVIAIVGDTVFSHAGVLGDWVTHVDDTNLAARCWLDGQAGDAHHPPSVLTSDDSPVWTRALGTAGATDCGELDHALAALGAKRMVVAHTVQRDGITSACDGKLWRIDVGLARLYGGPIEVLELARGAPPRVLRGERL